MSVWEQVMITETSRKVAKILQWLNMTLSMTEYDFEQQSTTNKSTNVYCKYSTKHTIWHNKTILNSDDKLSFFATTEG